MRLPLIVVVLGACATGGQPEVTPDSSVAPPPQPDGAVGPPPDGPSAPPDSSNPPPPPTGTLLISEVSLAPAAGEFIEIANPSAQAVDLSMYYLADSGNYFRLPAGATVDSSDFIVRFPAGASIAAGAAITIAFDTAASFQTAYGVAPTFSIASGTITTVVSSGTPTLTNSGELVVLFRWDGQGDLVRDVDLVLVGAPTAANGIVDKSGQAIDGPDADTVATAYGSDARTIAAQGTAPGAGFSTKRIARETGFESAGPNGLAGDDETSENTAMTWDTTFTAPTPNALPAGLVP